MTMNAGDILGALLKLGTIVHDAFTKAHDKDSSMSWLKFFESVDYKQLEQTVSTLAHKLKAADTKAAIAQIKAKQKTLLHGREIADLSTPELSDYSALSRARLMLATTQLEKAMEPSFLTWLVDDGLPKLASLAPTVIALLA